MKDDNREIEAKFAVKSVDEFYSELEKSGAVCEQPRQFERNLRFDDKDGNLSRERCVLRLRDNGGKAVLTFKSDKNSSGSLADREEIETAVEDFERTKLILERLGYEIFFIYEKFRSIYNLNGCGIFLDHTPIGDFVEIEGRDEAAICRTAEMIGLDPDTRSGEGYRALFNKWKKDTGYSGSNMTFDGIQETEQPA